MSVNMAIDSNFGQEEMKMHRMIIISIVIHVLLFCAFFVTTGSSNSGLKMNEVVYEVNLVELPQNTSQKSITSTTLASSNSTSSRKSSNARRISTSSRKKKALPVAKRTVKKRSSKSKKLELTSNQQLERAISKIEKKTKTGKKDYLESAIAALDKKAGTSKPGSRGNTASTGGLTLRLYQTEVESRIKSQWEYPDAIRDQNKIEAIILLKINKDGTILDTKFIKRSNDNFFDESVLKAIEKSKPLPPLPEGYNKNDEEIEINFNLKDLE